MTVELTNRQRALPKAAEIAGENGWRLCGVGAAHEGAADSFALYEDADGRRHESSISFGELNFARTM